MERIDVGFMFAKNDVVMNVVCQGIALVNAVLLLLCLSNRAGARYVSAEVGTVKVKVGSK